MDARDKTILITGATSGIGLAGAEAFGRLGWRVLVHGRTAKKAGFAVARLLALVPDGRFDAVAADLAKLASVVELADWVRSLAPRLDVLWNNAGLQVSTRQVTAEGVELQMAVNHLAGFVLTRLLLPQLQGAQQGRVLVTSSSVQSFAPRRIDDWLDAPAGKAYPTLGMYAQSKLANRLFVQELATRLQGTRVTAHAFHPGYVKTDFGSSAHPLYHWAFRVAVAFGLTAAQGAAPAVYLAEEPAVAAHSGRYWHALKLAPPSKRCTPVAPRALWEQSERAAAAYLPKV